MRHHTASVVCSYESLFGEFPQLRCSCGWVHEPLFEDVDGPDGITLAVLNEAWNDHVIEAMVADVVRRLTDIQP